MKVYLGDDKADRTVFATPIAAVRYRINEMYRYLEPEVLAEAERIVAAGDQREAWLFLLGRSDGEYEGINSYEVIE